MDEKHEFNFNQNKILSVIKPIGASTYDMIRIFKTANNFTGKIGHGGTLDPFASGIVLLLLGQATKKFDEIRKWQKIYLAGIRLGVVSTTDDIEGVFKRISDKKPLKKDIIKVLDEFIGKKEQNIPAFSAAKHKGTPLYKLARQGKIIKKSKIVDIARIDFINYKYPLLTIRVKCYGGVYIRQLARDIGEKLGVGAFLYYLNREAIGKFNKGEILY